MDLKLANKVVFVSGSSSGIGFSIAKVLYNEGCTVILNGRHKSSLKKSAKSKDSVKRIFTFQKFTFEIQLNIKSDF